MSEPLKLKQWVNNIKLQNKLVIIYVVTGLLPLIILFVFAYGQMRSILMDRDVRSMESALRQSVTTVDGQIEVYDNLSNYITFNETVSGILSYNYSNKYEMYSQIVTTFDPLVSSLKYFHNDINKVTIYINNGIKHDTTLAPLSEIENEAFYNSAVNSTNINWYVDKDKKELISARKMSTLATAGITGIMYINVDYDSIMDIYAKGLIDNSGIIVTDGNGSIISKKAAFLDNADKYILSDSRFTEFMEKADFSENVCSNIAGYVLIKQNSDVTGWTSYVYAPKSLMLKSTNSIITMIVLALVVACIGMAAATIFTSDFITKRISSSEKPPSGPVMIETVFACALPMARRRESACSFSYGSSASSHPAARRTASSNDGITSTCGIRPLPDCAAADAAIFCQRSRFFSAEAASSFSTQREDGKAAISYAPSSVAFWITCSSLSAFA